MGSELLPIEDVVTYLATFAEQLTRLVEANGSCEDQIRSLEHSITFSEYQFNIPSLPGRHNYCTRSDGVVISNLTVAHAMSSQYLNLGTRYSNKQSLKGAALAAPYYKKSRDVLEPLLLLLDEIEDTVEFTYILENREHLLGQLSRTEKKIAINCMELNRFQESDTHCRQCLYFAKKMKVNEEISTSLMVEALLCYGELREHQYWGDCEITAKGAYDYFEEAYLLTSQLYGPVHPLVHDVSNHLIGSLIKLGDFSEAERFARVNYESLISRDSGINPDGREVMKGASMLVKISYVTAQQTGNPLVTLDEAEELARTAVRIAIKSDGLHGYDSGIYQFDLYLVLKERDRLNVNLTDVEIKKSNIERKLLLDRALATTVRCHGENSKDTMYMHTELQFFHNYLGTSKSLDTETENEKSEKRNSLLLACKSRDKATLISVFVNGIYHPLTLSMLRQYTILDLIYFLLKTFSLQIISILIPLYFIYKAFQ